MNEQEQECEWEEKKIVNTPRKDMKHLKQHVLDILNNVHDNEIYQTDLWKKLDVTSREGSRLCISLEEENKISREKCLVNGRWSYKLRLIKPKLSERDFLEIVIPQEYYEIPDNSDVIDETDEMDLIYEWGKKKVSRSRKGNMDKEIYELESILDCLGNPEFRNQIAIESHEIYKTLLNANFIRGRSIESVIGSIIYAVCRINSLPVSLREISRCSSQSRKSIARVYRNLIERNLLKVPLQSYDLFLDQILDKLSIDETLQNISSEEIREKAMNIVNLARKKRWTHGKNPCSVAAASIYIACNKKVTQSEIAYAAGVTEVTLRNNYQKLEILLNNSKNN